MFEIELFKLSKKMKSLNFISVQCILHLFKRGYQLRQAKKISEFSIKGLLSYGVLKLPDLWNRCFHGSGKTNIFRDKMSTPYDFGHREACLVTIFVTLGPPEVGQIAKM